MFLRKCLSFSMFWKSGSVSLVFPSSASNGVDTIVISVENHGIVVENYLKSDFEPEISWINGVSGEQTGGRVWDLPKGHLALGAGGKPSTWLPPGNSQNTHIL